MDFWTPPRFLSLQSPSLRSISGTSGISRTAIAMKEWFARQLLFKGAFGNCKWEGFQEGGFRNSWLAAFSLRGDLLLQGSSYSDLTLRLLLRPQFWGLLNYCENPPPNIPHSNFPKPERSCNTDICEDSLRAQAQHLIPPWSTVTLRTEMGRQNMRLQIWHPAFWNSADVAHPGSRFWADFGGFRSRWVAFSCLGPVWPGGVPNIGSRSADKFGWSWGGLWSEGRHFVSLALNLMFCLLQMSKTSHCANQKDETKA